MTEDDWNDLLDIVVAKLIDRAKAECDATATSSELADKLGEFLFTTGQTINMSGDRARTKEYLINTARFKVTHN